MTNTALHQQPASLTLDNALQQAVAYHQSGQLQDAESLYRAILQAQPNHPDANHNLGALAMQTKQAAAGLPHFKLALEANPNQEQYWLSYIDALIQTGQADAARQILEQKRLRGLFGEKFKILAARIEKQSNNAPSQQEMDELVALLNQGLLAETELLACELTERFPLHGFGWKLLGIVFKRMGRNEEALFHMQKVTALSPSDAEAHYNFGIILMELRRFDEAEASYRRALGVEPNFAKAHYNLGITLMTLGRIDEAEASYRRTLKIVPNFAEAHNNLGTTLLHMGRLDEAEASYQRALEIAPDFAEVHSNLGFALQYLGRLDDAEVSYKRALELMPDDPSLYFNLHSLLLNQHDITSSIKHMEKAVEIDPSNVEYRFFMGMLLDYSGEQDASVDHFNRVENSANLHRARLDAWRHLKSANNLLPLISGSNIQTFKLGINIAVNDGLVLEFGVRFGSSIRQIAALAGQTVHGFDSFEGLPEQWHNEPRGSYSTKGIIPNIPDNVTLHVGWFEDTLPEFLKQHIAPVRFINIDCDIYSSTKTVLDLLADRIIPGTVIVFDEYIGNEHWREDEFKAFQEAVVKYRWNYQYICFSFSTKQVVVQIV